MTTVKCCICFENVGESDKQWVVLSGCGHSLHEQCLDQCERPNQHLKCPLCKSRVSQNCDAHTARILQRNHPLKCYLEAEELDDLPGPISPSASGASDSKQIEFERQIREMRERLREQHTQVEVANAQMNVVLEQLKDEEARLALEKARNTDVQRRIWAKQQQLEAHLANEVRAKRHAEETVGQMEVKLNALEADEMSRRLSDPTIHFPPHEFSDELQRLGQLTRSTVNETLRQRADRSDAEYSVLMKKFRAKTAALSSSVDALSEEIARLKLEKDDAEAATQRATAAALAASTKLQRRPLVELPCNSAAPWPQTSPMSATKAVDEQSQRSPGDRSGGLGGRENSDASEHQDDATDTDAEAFVDLPPDDSGAAAMDSRPVSSSLPPGAPRSALGGGFLGSSASSSASFFRKSAATGFVGGSILGSSHSSGSFIRHGPDGKGGTTKVFAPSAFNRQAGTQHPFPRPAGVKKGGKSVTQIQRKKGAGSRGGAALKMTDFLERDGGPVIQFS